jgi:hypothetical protein
MRSRRWVGAVAATMLGIVVALMLVLGAGERAARPDAAAVALKPTAAAAATPTSLPMRTAATSAAAKRSEPAARRERAASRTAHRNLTPTAVKALVRDLFPELVKAPPSTTERLTASGAKLVKFQGSDRAIVKFGSKRAVAALTSALSVKGRSIDPALQRSGSVYAPRQAATDYAVPAVLPADGEGAVAFENSGVDVGFSVAGGRSSKGVPVDGGVIFPSAARDLDVLVRPGSDTVELSALLRSPDAARTVRVSVDGKPGDDLVSSLPDSTGARQGPPGGAILLRSGRPAVHVSPATALDAQGKVLKVDLEIDGLDLVYTVQVPDDVAWPIALDPYISEDQRFWSNNANINFLGWSPGSAGGSFGMFQGSSGFGRGLYLFSNPGQPYASGAYASWRYQAPFNPSFVNDGARIFKADFGFVTHTLSNRGSCVGEGIFRNSAGTFEPAGRFRGSQPTDTYALYPSPYTFAYLACAAQTNGYTVHCLAVCDTNGGPDTGGSPANSVSLHLYQGAGTPSTGSVVYMQGSLIFMSESVGPRTTFTSTAPASWTKDAFTINATVNDYGLGINSAAVSAPGATGLATATQVASCASGTPPNGGITQGSSNQGDRDHRCTAPLTLSQASSGLPDGSYDLSVQGNDILGNPMQAPNITPVKLDRSPPQLSVTGQLRDLAGAVDASGSDLFELSISATDGSSGSPRVGVRDVVVKVDNVEIERYTTPVSCVDSCRIDVNDFVLNTDDYSEGSHRIRVEATDRLGNASEPVEWDISVPRSSYYATRLAAWKAAVEQQVDNAVPIVPLVGAMPTPPAGWNAVTQCEQTAANLKACYDAVRQWGMSVKNWLQLNLVAATAIAGQLPSPPTFEYALSDATALDLTRRARDAFELAASSVVSPLAALNVAISFHEPVTPATVLALLPGLPLQQQVAFSGVFDPGGADLSGTMTSPTAKLLPSAMEDFYVKQIAIAEEDLAEMTAMVPEDPEEASDILTSINDHRAFVTALQARQPFITGVSVQLSLPALLQSVLDVDLAGVIKGVKKLPAALPLVDGALDVLSGSATNSATVRYAQRRAAAPAPGSPAATAASTSTAYGQACYDRGEYGRVGTRVMDPNPTYYAPSRYSYNTSLGALDGGNGRHLKYHRLRWRWQSTRSLAWMCAGSPGDRNVEIEAKVFPDNDRRWSENWESNSVDRYTQHNGPAGKVHQDDIASGDSPLQFPPGNPVDKQKYPDFAVIFQSSADFQYRKLYKVRFVTNEGKTDEGKVIYRAQANRRAKTNGEKFYCTVVRNRDYKSCMFGTTTACIDTKLIASAPARRTVDWRSITGEAVRMATVAAQNPNVVDPRSNQLVNVFCNPSPPGDE